MSREVLWWIQYVQRYYVVPMIIYRYVPIKYLWLYNVDYFIGHILYIIKSSTFYVIEYSAPQFFESTCWDSEAKLHCFSCQTFPITQRQLVLCRNFLARGSCRKTKNTSINLVYKEHLWLYNNKYGIWFKFLIVYNPLIWACKCTL